MWAMLWPVLVAVGCNSVYQICQKSTPEQANPFLSLTVTYLVAAVVSAVCFFAGSGFAHTGEELGRLNWTSYVLGAVIVGLEIGFLYLYRAGWKVSVGSLVCNLALAIVMIFVGWLLYKETITLRQLIGIAVCAVGLFLVSK